MADIFTGDLTMSDDWGKVITEQYPNGIPASGQSIQKFIKDNLSQKASYFYAVDDEVQNQNVLITFRSQSDCDEWVVKFNENEGVITDNLLQDELVLHYVRLNKAQPVAYDSVLLENKMDSTTIISTDNIVKVRLKFSSTHYEPNGNVLIPSSTGEEGTLVMQRKTGTGAWETKYETIIPSIDANDDVATTEIDLTQYLVNGFQEVRIMVTGNTTGITTNWLKYNITKTNLGLVFATPWQYAQDTNYMQLSYYINGAVDKTLNIKITGPGGKGSRTYTENIGNTVFGINSGTPKVINISDSNLYNYKVVTEGVHNVEAWISVNNTNIESEHIHSQVLMVPKPTTKSYIIINELNTTLINWTDQTLFKYALYSPYGNTMPISFTLGDYNTDDIYFEEKAASKSCGVIHTLTHMMEVESEESITAKMDITTTDASGNEVYLLNPFEFFIDNNINYSPTEGADFIFNPKIRNNDEKDPTYVSNSANGEAITAKWNGFNFTTDGWVKDADNNKCLRVLAGQSVELEYNPFDNWGVDKSCTIEMVIASRNISDETHPIISLSRRSGDGYESYNGLEIWPTKAVYKTPGCKNDITQDVLFREGVPTHIAINIMHNMYSYMDANGSHPINLVRIFVNGVINREFAYSEDTLADVGQELTTPRKIIFGAANAGADLDVYSVRIYKSKLSAANILQDYIASLPTTGEKDSILFKNDILGDDGTISYEKVKDKYNTLLWKYSENAQRDYENGVGDAPVTRMVGLAEGNHDDTKDTRQYGDLVIRIIKEDGTVDTDRSGVLNDMSVQGQGTSSMGYWKWNQRWVFQEAGKDKDKDGINSKYTSVFTAENPNSSHNGKSSWQPFDGAPFAKKLDAKINWASPMQSHKIGSTKMYNDLWKTVVKDNEITRLGTSHDGAEFTGTDRGYADCRVTVGQVPFMMFCQKDKDSPIEFYGLYTMGPSKGDKPTFGYNDELDLFKNFSMIEGCDNGTLLVIGRTPWNDIDVTLNDDEDIFMYNGVKQYELSMGETGKEYADNSVTIQNFKEWNRFVYLLNPNLKYFDGKFEDLQKDTSLDTEAFYWTTKGDANAAAYNVYRYDMMKKRWVNAGVDYAVFDKNGVGIDYEVVNLITQLDIDEPSDAYAAQNQTFINKRAEKFAERIEEWFDKDDFLFTMCFLKLIAASDNWAKNTYIYNAGFTDEEGKLTSKWRFFQDDLDTIFSLNNTGYKVKPYYVEEHDKRPSDNSNYFNSDTNALYCLAELAWASELRSMMNRILAAAASLGGSVMGCFDKYYNKIPKYFPQVSYNEIAKLLYEDGYVNYLIGNYNPSADPLAQAVGDQLEAEMEWQRLRSIYMSSYAQFGEFSAADGAGSAGALNFRSSQIVDEKGNTQSAAYRFEITPSMWLYPSMAKGGSSLQADDDSDPDGKVKKYTMPPRTKAGDKVVFTLDAGEVDGNTQLYIRGINYYNDIGNFGSIATNPADKFNIGGAKLTQFKATDEGCENGMPFRPIEMTIPTSGMDNIKKFIIRGKVMANTKIVSGLLDLSGLWRLEEVDVTATNVNEVKLPQNSNIVSLSLPSTIEKLYLSNQQKLTKINILGVQSVKEVKVINSPNFDSYDIINLLYKNGVGVETCNIDNINWTDVTVDMLKYLINIPTCSLSGIIDVKRDEIIDFNLKSQLINKFGDIDNTDNGLHIIYTGTELSVDNSKIIGESYITTNGDYQYSLEIRGNKFKEYNWGISANDYATISNSGLLTYTDVSDGGLREAEVTCNVYLQDPVDGSWLWWSKSKKIYFEPKKAEIGDYVYADGSISSQDDLNTSKTVIGMCYYVNPNDPTDRRMVALKNIAQTYWGLGNISGLPDDVMDIEGVTNISSLKSGGDVNSVKMSDIEDPTTADGFKVHSATTAVGDIGTIKLDKVLTTEIKEYQIGDVLPVGMYKTLEIIEHRNEVVIKPGKYNFNEVTLRIPGRNISGQYTVDEYVDLEALLTNIVTATKDELNTCYYYPAASYCYAYTPDVGNLHPNFSKHNWYLPTLGELVRVYYCEQKSKFDNAIGLKLYNTLSSTTWTSTEWDEDRVWAFTKSSAGPYIFTVGSSKTSKMSVRPVARF